VKIVSPARRPVPPVHFELVGGALMRRRRVRLDYFVRSRREASERVVSPQRLVHWRNTWYLDAWCHKSDGLRRFSLDAIRGGAMLEQKAKEVPIKTIEAELDGGYGIFSGATLQWATLRFTPEAAEWVRHEQWHPAQETKIEEDGSLTMKVPYADATELAMDVLRHGEQVRVLEPAGLAQTVAERLRKSAQAYA
jgi:predicted DNA-binding transcriptional regulator YafY